MSRIFKTLVLFLLLFPCLCFSQEKDEVIYRIPNVVIHNVLDVSAISGEKQPGFLTKRGDFEAFKKITGNGKGVKVGIVDTGLDPYHAKLGGELELFNSRYPDSTNVAVREVKDFTRSRRRWTDRAGHGTHVAGHIGARRNGRGIEGIASECELYIAKGLDDRGIGTDHNLAAGILWLIEKEVDIINLSVGGGFSPRIEAAVKKATDKGILVFAAAGNEGRAGVGHPGKSKYTIAVGAVDYNLNIASFSSRGKEVMLSGYGVGILSTVSNGRFAEYDGTSMSTPDQSGIAALIIGYCRKIGRPIQGMADYMNFVKPNIMDLGVAGRDKDYGYGFIVIDRITKERRPSEPVEPTDPSDPVEPTDPTDKFPYANYKKVGEAIIGDTRIIFLQEIK